MSSKRYGKVLTRFLSIVMGAFLLGLAFAPRVIKAATLSELITGRPRE